jgi:hypothetical protein
MTLLRIEIEARSKLFQSVGQGPRRHPLDCSGQRLCNYRQRNGRPAGGQIDYNLAIYCLMPDVLPNDQIMCNKQHNKIAFIKY